MFKTNSDVKILFLGTAEVAATLLDFLISESFDIVAVVSQEDKPTGRHGILTPSPVKRVALDRNIPVYTPHKIRTDFAFANDLNFDVIVCMAYGQIIPMALIQMAPKGAINLHGSLLPALRGAAPVQRAIINGLSVTGVTLMEMAEGMDSGRIYDQKEVTIEDDDNATRLMAKIGQAACALVRKDLLAYCNDEIQGIPQNEELVTFAPKFEAADEHLALDQTVATMWRLIRGLNENPGAYLYLDGKKFKIYRAHPYSEAVTAPIGTLILEKKHALLQLKDGQLSLDEVQLEGKKRMDIASFLNGSHFGPNVILS